MFTPLIERTWRQMWLVTWWLGAEQFSYCSGSTCGIIYLVVKCRQRYSLEILNFVFVITGVQYMNWKLRACFYKICSFSWSNPRYLRWQPTILKDDLDFMLQIKGYTFLIWSSNMVLSNPPLHSRRNKVVSICTANIIDSILNFLFIQESWKINKQKKIILV